jgi:hypothetical protein
MTYCITLIRIIIGKSELNRILDCNEKQILADIIIRSNYSNSINTFRCRILKTRNDKKLYHAWNLFHCFNSINFTGLT